jgi:hypothetical protein
MGLGLMQAKFALTTMGYTLDPKLHFCYSSSLCKSSGQWFSNCPQGNLKVSQSSRCSGDEGEEVMKEKDEQLALGGLPLLFASIVVT